jgi:di/tricarboxylate transporter
MLGFHPIAKRRVLWLAGLVATPALLYLVSPPELKSTPEAPGLATQRLQQLGPVQRDEAIMMLAMLLAVVLWVSGACHCGVLLWLRGACCVPVGAAQQSYSVGAA